MAFEFAVAGIRVIGHLVGVEYISAIVKFTFAAKMVDLAILFLLYGSHRHIFPTLGSRRGGRGRRLGIGGKGLAGNYPGCEKQMTEQRGRDKDSRAGDHLQLDALS